MTKKIGLICLALVMALGAMGVGYARWYQDLYINGTVETGTFITGFGELTLAEVPEYLDKDVGSVTGYMTVLKGTKPPLTPGEPDREYYENIWVTLHKAYPSYKVRIIFTVGNCGTIPAHVKSLTPSDPTGYLKFVWIDAPPATPAFGYFFKDLDADGQLDLGVEDVMDLTVVNLVSDQIDPCSEKKAEADVHVRQQAEQGRTYKFKITVDTEQWNAP